MPAEKSTCPGRCTDSACMDAATGMQCNLSEQTGGLHAVASGTEYFLITDLGQGFQRTYLGSTMFTNQWGLDMDPFFSFCPEILASYLAACERSSRKLPRESFSYKFGAVDHGLGEPIRLSRLSHLPC